MTTVTPISKRDGKRFARVELKNRSAAAYSLPGYRPDGRTVWRLAKLSDGKSPDPVSELVFRTGGREPVSFLVRGEFLEATGRRTLVRIVQRASFNAASLSIRSFGHRFVA